MLRDLGVRIGIALTVSIIFWASAFAGIRAALEDFSPAPMALFRFSVASIVLLIIIVGLIIWITNNDKPAAKSSDEEKCKGNLHNV